jgi:hypothetical protein
MWFVRLVCALLPSQRGTIADQRVKLQRELPVLKEESKRHDIHDYGARCIIVAGRLPASR